ncbi:sensor domain-containing diguanylate cyclase [Halobacillus sp. A5]|uniref:sensor domain-containing diguanylate cyclase n=1 Tax=Halobacillus sp. A5 TaxID=2880263 RepID=UPI0020A66E6D|nr:sensor domain-containing diguanylate cyclase [Halobacillus sp. A5]MCP3025533.1 sensor domain-containing diguanylate cyclase [Halobacillus sp. A5]
MISTQKKLLVYIIWLMVWPVTLYIVFIHTSFPLEEYKIDIAGFIILASIVALFPLLMGDHPVFLTNGVSFSAFLFFGLFVEIIVIQISLLFLMMKLQVGKANFFRIPLNMVMFLLISLVTAGVYYSLGGGHGDEALNSGFDAVPVIAYALTQIVVNQLSLKLIGRYLYKRKLIWIDQGVKWELLTTALVAPVGLMLYFVYTEIGPSAIYLIGFPFFLISIMVRQFHKTSQVNTYLQKTGDIGHELTGSLGVKDVLDVFVKRVTDLLPLDYLFIFDINTDNEMKLVRFYDRANHLQFPDVDIIEGPCISKDTWRNGKGMHLHTRKKWNHLKNAHTPIDAESVISIPISRQNKTVGIITMYAAKQRAFFKYQYMILNILGSYLAVAIENARHYEKTKTESERCPLTGLYNYRYFENYLQVIAEDRDRGEQQQPVSQILIDLDHFKSVNDQFGHEAGNEILCEVAKRLENVIGERGVAARYGGEEFVILLPDVTNIEAEQLAEKVRASISDSPFVAYANIQDAEKTAVISVSASIGVASFPADSENILELTRHADRAMYVGAKQMGRNRVASYEKLKLTAE